MSALASGEEEAEASLLPSPSSPGLGVAPFDSPQPYPHPQGELAQPGPRLEPSAEVVMALPPKGQPQQQQHQPQQQQQAQAPLQQQVDVMAQARLASAAECCDPHRSTHGDFCSSPAECSARGGQPGEAGRPEGALRRIAVFGSSLNPCTGLGGHQGIVEYFARIYDAVWVVPVYRHQYASKNTQEMLPFESRMEICRRGLGHIPNLRISRVEERLIKDAEQEAVRRGEDPQGVVLGSHLMLARLQREHPDCRFSFILGGDTFQDLIEGKWLNATCILQSHFIEVVCRSVVQIVHPKIPVLGYRVHEVPGLTDISSTMIRELADLEALSDPANLHPKVLDFILENGLYRIGQLYGPDRKLRPVPAEVEL